MREFVSVMAAIALITAAGALGGPAAAACACACYAAGALGEAREVRAHVSPQDLLRAINAALGHPGG